MEKEGNLGKAEKYNPSIEANPLRFCISCGVDTWPTGKVPMPGDFDFDWTWRSTALDSQVVNSQIKISINETPSGALFTKWEFAPNTYKPRIYIIFPTNPDKVWCRDCKDEAPSFEEICKGAQDVRVYEVFGAESYVDPMRDIVNRTRGIR